MDNVSVKLLQIQNLKKFKTLLTAALSDLNKGSVTQAAEKLKQATQNYKEEERINQVHQQNEHDRG